MENTIEVKVTTKHFKNATQYTDSNSCPLALAVKDVFPDATSISVVIGSVRININGEYQIFKVTTKWSNSQSIYRGKFKFMSIDDMISLAKEGVRIPTEKLVLELV